MVCHEECIPGKATVAIDLPSAENPSIDHAAESPAYSRVRSWLDRLPEDAVGSGWIVESQSLPGGTPQSVDIRLSIRSSDPSVVAADWFPAPSPSLLVKNVKVVSEGGATVVVFSLNSMFGPIGAGETFESLLVYRDDSNRERGVLIVTPLTAEPVS